MPMRSWTVGSFLSDTQASVPVSGKRQEPTAGTPKGSFGSTSSRRLSSSSTQLQKSLGTCTKSWCGTWQSFGIPYRIVNVCTGDMGTVAAKKYDLEAWLPGQGKYREMASCSNCTSYQAVRSKIRYREKPNEPTKYLHTLNSTLVATERAIVAILENFQKPDGMIEIPLVLQKYMGGQEFIPGPKVMLISDQGAMQNMATRTRAPHLDKDKS